MRPVSDNEEKLAQMFQRRKEKILAKGRDQHLHSKEHLLADDLSKMLGEPNRFAAYLGIAKLYYESDLLALAKRVAAKEDLPREACGKYFFAALRSLAKKPGVKFKRKNKRKKRAASTKATARPKKKNAGTSDSKRAK